MLGQLCRTPVVEALFQRDRHRLRLQVLGHVTVLVPHLKRRIQMGRGQAHLHGFVRLGHVDTRQPLQDGIYHDGHGMVANHAIIVLPPQLPNRQIPVIVILAYHAVHKIRGAFRFQHRIKRMGGTESIPQRKSAVMYLSHGQTAHGIIRSHILPIRVGHHIRLNHSMVECRIEYLLLMLPALYLHFPKLLVPSFVCLRLDGIERFSVGLRTQVQTGILYRDRRDGQFAFHHVLPSEIEDSLKVRAVHHRDVPVRPVVVHHLRSHDGLGEFRIEVDFTQFTPTGDDAVTLDGRRSYLPYLRIDDAPSPTAFVGRVVQVEKYLGGFLLIIIGIAVYAYTPGGRQLGIDAVVLQQHTVIARHGILLLVREPRLLAVLVHGEHEDVDEIRSTRPAQPRMREAENRLVVIVISRSLPPVRRFAGIRRELHHPERYGGTRIIVSTQALRHRARSDKRIHITGHVLRRNGMPQSAEGQSPQILFLHDFHYLSSITSPFFK